MNCETVQRLMLLASSGELSGWQRWRLARHRSICPACRQAEQEMLRLVDTARQALPEVAPGAGLLTAIRRAAETELRRRPLAGNAPRFSPALRNTALAVALALLVVAFGWSLRLERSPSLPAVASAPAVQETDELFTTELFPESEDLAVLSAEDVFYVERFIDGTGTDTINALDLELLWLEGLAI
ncbi:MAG: hypothetical protein HY343_00340 [Lentisphaerae bacterium]|nr:hypothetical protein [Lentisphaerota bacterium]